jgi:hypothetical protein
MHVVDPATHPTAELYPLVISAVVPRPIGFTASVSKDGSVNLAPYSYFNVLGHNPFIVALGICRSPGRAGGKKDTLQNIEETREFTINLMSEWFVEVRGAVCCAVLCCAGETHKKEGDGVCVCVRARKELLPCAAARELLQGGGMLF